MCNCFDDFRTNRPKSNGRSHRKENTNFAKLPWVRSKNVGLSSALLFSLVVNKKNVLRNSWDLSTWNNTCFLVNSRVTFWLRYFSPNATFGTLALYIMRLRCLAIPNTYKNSFWFFSETWSSLFRIVCNCFDDFRTNFPKNNGRSHRKENINFPKWRWIRSKNVCLSSALLFSLVLTKIYVLRTSWGLSTWNKTCFLFKCRVTFRLGQFSKARFGTLALYNLRLRCLVISKTYKNSSFLLSKTENFRNDVEYVPEMVFWALLSPARLDSLDVNKKSCFENLLRSLYMKQYVFFVQLQRHLLAAIFFERCVRYFGSLHPAFEMSCDTEYLEKNNFWFFRKRGLRRFGLCAIVLMIFVQTVRKIMGDLTERKTSTFQNDVEYVPKMSVWALLCYFLWF